MKTTSNETGQFHAVRFYDSRESLCRMVAEFLGEGFVSAQPALIIATPEHRAGILGELRTRHFDVDRMQAAGDLLVLDADTVLASFMVDGTADPDLFQAAAASALDTLRRGRPDFTIRAYGEMVDVLWKTGEEVAAIRLEMLWNKLAKTHDFELLCGYAMGSFYKDAGLEAIHHQHSHVVTDDGVTRKVRSSIH
jgi:hypothetical protein